MPVEEAPDDDSNVRQSYNFAPGYHGLVYRADGPETGGQHEGATEDTKYKLQSMQWGRLSQAPGHVTPTDTMHQVSCHSGQSAIPTTDPR
jgi:putative SOS response-associated peptidase YedK